MSDDKWIEAIRAREKAATPGPWEAAKKSVRVVGADTEFGAPTGVSGEGVCNTLGIGSPWGGVNHPANVRARDNAQFIAHAREDIPWLLAQLDAANAEIAALRERVLETKGGDKYRRNEKVWIPAVVVKPGRFWASDVKVVVFHGDGSPIHRFSPWKIAPWADLPEAWKEGE